jgi:hypothetical protein
MLLFHVKRLARREGWVLSDLVRMLIVLGATVCWLRVRNEKDLNRLGKIAHADQMSDMLNEAVSNKRRTRVYPIVRDEAGRATDVVTLILPAGYARLIDSYVSTNRISRSNACERLLTFGLISYLTVENTIHQAVQQVRAQPESQAAPQTPM